MDAMRRDADKYLAARDLRKLGKSIRSIAKLLKISSSTASVWCKDIKLTQEQRSALDRRENNLVILQRNATKRHLEKLSKDHQIFKKAQIDLRELNNYERFVTGIALYWAEGFKNAKEGRVGFCNSDPRMVRFMIRWFEKVLQIPREDITLRAEYNIDLADSGQRIEKYWSEITSIPLSQFSKPFLQHSKLKRVYENRSTYNGVLRIRIRKSSALLPKLKGWIEALSLS